MCEVYSMYVVCNLRNSGQLIGKRYSIRLTTLTNYPIDSSYGITLSCELHTLTYITYNVQTIHPRTSTRFHTPPNFPIGSSYRINFTAISCQILHGFTPSTGAFVCVSIIHAWIPAFYYYFLAPILMSMLMEWIHVKVTWISCITWR